jgi:Flp pilus assembly secretin CpaC
VKHLARCALVALSLCSIPTLADPSQKPAPQAEGELLSLRAGSTQALEIVGVTRIALGDPDIADVELQGDHVIQIKGVKAGETRLLVWTGEKRKAYRIVVQ